MRTIINTRIANALRQLDRKTVDLLCSGCPMPIALGDTVFDCQGGATGDFLEKMHGLLMEWNKDLSLTERSAAALRKYWEDPDREVEFCPDDDDDVQDEGIDEPQIRALVFTHQLPKHLQPRYLGKSLMGRLFWLQNRLGESEFRWAECGLHEESWYYSEELHLGEDHEVLDILKGAAHGKAI